MTSCKHFHILEPDMAADDLVPPPVSGPAAVASKRSWTAARVTQLVVGIVLSLVAAIVVISKIAT